ncbi:MAG TPA: UvrD-helicase domain-containing protein, partial [Acidimicrobiales bacterium]|nr:UvrD-helicase domain-containing protein [Acidimicrobiales bacterium]
MVCSPDKDRGRLALHPDLEAEQAYVDYAYECLEAARRRAASLGSMVEVGRGGTEQARFERDVIWDTIVGRLRDLELGDASLVFGRIDTTAAEGPAADGGDTYYIGRLAVADEGQEPVVVDWRAPVAEPFYRATGRAPMGLDRRRHFAARGRQLLGIEDEYFGAAATRRGAAPDGIPLDDAPVEVSGQQSLLASLESARTGRLTDIVATIQGEQDEIIRGELPGVLVVQGGPGTGKTVVALHRAAYLLYTHRFPLEGQGVLVVGPNRLFLGYIEQVLPSLGEAGVELVVLADLLADTVGIRDTDTPTTARVKGDLRMAKVLANAVRDRRRPLRDELRVGLGVETLAVTVEQSAAIVSDARRRARTHNAGRRFVEQGLFEALAVSSRFGAGAGDVRDRLRHTGPVREALDWMWPVLTPAQLLHDLFGSRALLRSAAGARLDDMEINALYRVRSSTIDEVAFTSDDVPLLDEARALLGARPRRKGRPAEDDEVRTYGHIVVDEAQDLSPMQLRMLARRSLGGSMTVVGDIAQATGAWAHASWDEILALLPDRRPPRRAALTIGYRIPGPNMELASRVLRVAMPDLAPPRSIRPAGTMPRLVHAESPAALGEAVAAAALVELEEVGTGNVGVIVPTSLVATITSGLADAGVPFGLATRNGLDERITV